jgi:hypothetical protein
MMVARGSSLESQRMNLESSGLDRPDVSKVKIRITMGSPCQVPWDSMRGTARERHCGQCQKKVYRVENLTNAEVLTLLKMPERPCLNVFKRPDGTVLTQDCSPKDYVMRRIGLVVLAFLGFSASLMSLFGDNVRSLFGESMRGALAAAPAHQRLDIRPFKETEPQEKSSRGEVPTDY